MPINTNLNTAPYFDDFDIENQYYRVLFKPGYAVQARELTQMQTMLQSQVEQFGDNIFKEGSIVKGCNFTQLDDLQYVRLTDTWTPAGASVETTFDPRAYVPKRVEELNQTTGQIIELDYVYQIVGDTSGLVANIIASDQGVEVRTPDLNTFYISYLNSNELNNFRVFQAGELLTINLYKFKVGTQDPVGSNPTTVGTVRTTTITQTTGKSFGIQAAPGIIFQKGHFLFADDQTLIVSKYSELPSDVSVGYRVNESAVGALSDESLYDNANGSNNENAPGADRLKLEPQLTVVTTSEARADADFFTLIRYQNGNAVTVRDVSQYNVLGEELARRTYEESGNYILKDFPVTTDDRVNPANTDVTDVNAIVGTGVAYVKGYRVENSGERSFKIDQIQSTQETSNQSVAFDYDGGFPITSIQGTLDIDWTSVNLQNSSSTNIGTAICYNLTPEKIYLTAIRLPSNTIRDVVKISDGNGVINIDTSRGNALSGQSQGNTHKTPLVFHTGRMSLFATSDELIPTRVKETMTQTGNVITINANPGEDFDCDNDDVLVVDSTSTPITVTSVSTAVNNSTLTINLDPADGSATSVTVYYNKRLVGSAPAGVEPYDKVVKEPFVKVSFSAGTRSYLLGFPDVFKIISVEDSSGNDYTNSFRLKKNQKDTYYDISYMDYIDGRPQPPNGVLTVQVKVFLVSPGSGDYYFTINSYPNTLDLYDIPVYTSTAGQSYNLRECLDFRPHVNALSGMNYDAIESNAPIIAVSLGDQPMDFSTFGAPLIPARNNSATIDIESYLSRIDLIVCDSYGEISLIKGKEDSFAVPPRVGNDKLPIAEIIIPGYPALSSKSASRLNKRNYAVVTRSTGIKAYTMKDMHQLDKRIDRMAYYISLNQLEQETQNLTILDENGLNRFKNGFVVDPFNNLSLADVTDSQFNASVPFNTRELAPSVKTYPIDLKYKTSSGVRLFPSVGNPKVATLGRDGDVAIISQPYASGFRNCVSNFYRYKGEGQISPPYDATYDTTTNPAEINIDFTSAFEDFVENIQEFVPLTDVSTEVITNINRFGDDFRWDATMFDGNWRMWGNQFGRLGGFAQDQIVTTTRTFELNTDNLAQNINVGEMVRDFRFEPYMSGRDVKIYMSGLRPNARHWFFFDGVDVNEHIIPGTNADNADDVQRFGQKADSVLTDENGVLRAVFALPPETFFVGDRVMEIADVDTYDQIESASISGGFVTYRAYNFSVEKTSLTASTRAPTFDINSSTSTRTVVRRVPGPDPLAQTFFIKKGMGEGSNSVYLSEIDIFFKRKSDINGVTIAIREVVNGYPTNQVVPFSKVHKLPADVSVSDDSSTPTTFVFEAPVRLDVEKEYAVSIQPDASDPNYLAYISKVGGTDLTPGPTQGASIIQDWGDGVLFSSTNNSAWRSYQDEDLKFVLRRHNFNESTGTVTLTNNDHEFLSVGNITGRFTVGEIVYQQKARTGNTQESIGLATGTRTITGTDLDQTYLDGDHILVTATNPTPRSEIYRIVSVDSASQMTIDRDASFEGSAGNPVVKGALSYYNINDPFEMHLEASNARSGLIFEVSPTSLITGLDSGTTAAITAVNNINLSYFQSMIMKSADSSSTILMDGTFVPPADLNSQYTMTLRFNDNNHFNNNGVVLFSKSNDPGRAQEFNINLDLANGGDVTSTPVVDVEISKLIGYKYKITNNPATTAKYISKKVELAIDLDAEDINVIVTGYRPSGTNIKVYIRAQNAFDSASFDEIEWKELELFQGNGIFSSTANIKDYREYVYRVAAADKDLGGALEYTSSGGTFSGFRRFSIRIDMISENVHNVPTLRDYRAIALT